MGALRARCAMLSAGRANGLSGTSTPSRPPRDTVWIGGSDGQFQSSWPFRTGSWNFRHGLSRRPWLAHFGNRVFGGLEDRIVTRERGHVRRRKFAAFHRGRSVAALLDAGEGGPWAACVSCGVAEFDRVGRRPCRLPAAPSFHRIPCFVSAAGCRNCRW